MENQTKATPMLRLQMRSIVSLTAVLGTTAIAIKYPDHASEALTILATAIGGYFSNLPVRKAQDDR